MRPVIIHSVQKVIFDPQIELGDQIMRINTNAELGQGCFVRILEKTYEQLVAMQSYHGKVLVCMSIYHMHDYSPDNKLFSKFIRKLRKRLKALYGLLRVGYLWVREQGENEKQHYHLALFLDGNKIRSSYKVFGLCVDIWEGWNQPRPSFPPRRSYYLLKRGDGENFQQAFFHLSYLAKIHTKGDKPPATNNYYTSQIKPRIGQ